MNYIISEEELFNLIDLVKTGIRYKSCKIKEIADDFLKSKTPVEVIVEGEVDTKSSTNIYVGGKAIWSMEFYNKLAVYGGKKGKLIWVEEIE
jgi:hypothetical protein